MAKRRKPVRRSIGTVEQHQLKVARATLKLPDAMVRVMGGPTKEQAREIIRRLSNPRASLTSRFVTAKVRRHKNGRIEIRLPNPARKRKATRAKRRKR